MYGKLREFGYTGSLDDMLPEWLKDEGSDNSLFQMNDLWYSMLQSKGYKGSFNDMLYQFNIDMGYEGLGGGILSGYWESSYYVLDGIDDYLSIPQIDIALDEDFEIRMVIRPTTETNAYLLASSDSTSSRLFYSIAQNKVEFSVSGEAITFSNIYPKTGTISIISFKRIGTTWVLNVNGETFEVIKAAAAFNFNSFGQLWGYPTTVNTFEGEYYSIEVWTGGDSKAGTLVRKYQPFYRTDNYVIDSVNGQDGTYITT